MKSGGPTLDGPWDGPSGRSGVLDETIVHHSGDDVIEPDQPQRYDAGTAISRYVVLYEVGAGGMGVVYAAFDPQLNRKIALKILTPKAKSRRGGLDQAVGRLMREAQAIARLSHPNVVNVYDVGRHDDAVFVAMEFIEGHTLSRWLALEDRTLTEIRDVFAKAGRGLAAAHRAGLVHRDFKPDNVLVSPNGRVRVLDFGLARADPTHAASQSYRNQYSMEEEDDEPALGDGVPQPREFADSDVLSSPLTLDDAVVGTPRYMAPEQHVGAGVDARSDQFSFCVALYQAIYRQEPYAANRLRSLVLLKQEGKVTDVPGDSGVPPWLEDLVFRGLSPAPGDRWDSMEEVVAALEKDPEATRKRWLTLGGGAVVLAAITAAAGHRLGATDRPCQDGEARVESTWNDERRDAVEAAIVGTKLSYAEHTWNEVERRVDEDLDGWVETYRETCEATRVRGDQSDELLDLRMACLQDHLHEVDAVLDVLSDADPAVVRQAVSAVSGLPDVAQCADAEGLREQMPLPTEPEQRAAIEQLRQKLREASAQKRASRLADAQRLANEALDEAAALGYEPLRVEALLSVGIIQEAVGDYPAAEKTLRQALWDAVRIGHDVVAAKAATQLVSVVGDRLARYDEGLLWYQQALALLDRTGNMGASRSSLLNNVGNVWHRKEDNEQALTYYQRALEITEGIDGADNPVLGSQRLNLGNAQLMLGQYDAALQSYQQARDTIVSTLGQGHPRVAMAIVSIGLVHNNTERYEEALAHFLEALPQFESWLGPEHLFVATTHSNIGDVYRRLKRYEEAEAALREAQSIYEASLGPDHPQVATCLAALADVRAERGFVDEALRLAERALALRLSRFGDDEPSVIGVRADIADLWRRQGKAAEAVTALEALAAQAESVEAKPALRGSIHHLLAKARWDAGEPSTKVRTEIARARLLFVEAEGTGRRQLRDLEAWEADHLVDDRPRGPDGQILAVKPAAPTDAQSTTPPAP